MQLIKYLAIYTIVVSLSLLMCGFTTTTSDPGKAGVVTSDVDHFWQAFDDAAKVPPPQRAGIYAKEYFDLGSPGLKDIVPKRLVSPAVFSSYVEKHRNFYKALRPRVRQVVSQRNAIEDVFHRLKMLYPDIRFPKHVYFVVGRRNMGGTSSDNGIILAAEMYTAAPGAAYSYASLLPDMVPFKVLHETVHFNQTVQPEGVNASLLQNTVLEGMADFIASLVLPEPKERQYTDRWNYGCAHEMELAYSFLKDEGLTTMEPWMYTYAPDNGWPPDMAYWMGYRINQAFYAQAKNKTAALHIMLGVTDFKAYLKSSGYPTLSLDCKPEGPRDFHSSL